MLNMDQGGIVEVRDRQPLRSLLLRQEVQRNATLLLCVKGSAQRGEFVPFGCRDQVAALDQARRGVFVLQVLGKALEKGPRMAGKLDVFNDRIVGPQDAAGLRGGAGADLLLLEHQHPLAPSAA